MIERLSTKIVSYLTGKYAEPKLAYYLIANGICIQCMSDNAHIMVVRYGKRVVKVSTVFKNTVRHQEKEYFKTILGLMTVDLGTEKLRLVLSKKAIPFTIEPTLVDEIVLDETIIRSLF